MCATTYVICKSNKINFILRVYTLLVVSILLSIPSIFAQAPKVSTDSLYKIINANKLDTTTVNAYLQLSKSKLLSDPLRGKAEAEKAMSIAKSIDWKKGMSKSHNQFGIIYYEQYAYSKAIEEYKVALQLLSAKTDGKYIANLYNNIGNAYSELRNHPLALDNYIKALNMNETINNQEGVSINCINITSFYTTKLKNYAAALQYAKKGLEVSTKLKDTLLMSEGIINLAITYKNMGKIDSALNLYQRAYALDNLIKNDRGLSIAAINMGIIYGERKDISTADSLFKASFGIAKKAGLKGIQIGALQCLSSLYIDKAKLSSGENARKFINTARQFAYAGIDSACSNGKIDTPQAYYKPLSEIEELSGNPTKALYYFKRGQKISDSIYSKENQDQINLLEQERKEVEKQRALDQEKQKARVTKTIQLLSIFTGILIMISFIIFLTSKKLNHRLIEFLGTLSVLAIFELITLMIHPFLEKITHHNLILMLLCLIIIASVIIPIHHRTEHWVKDFILKRTGRTKAKK